MAKRKKTRPKAKVPARTKSKRVKINYSKLFNIKSLTAIAVVFVILWFFYLYGDDRRVFDSALKSHLTTSGLIQEVNQTDAQSRINETRYISFLDKPTVQSVYSVHQNTPDLGERQLFSLEKIGTRDKNFVRYQHINSENIVDKAAVEELLELWGELDVNEGASQQSFLHEGLFSVLPVANLEIEEAGQLSEAAKELEVYKITNVEKRFVNLRPKYVYNIEVNPVNLVNYLNEYAARTAVDATEQLNPQNYRDSAVLKIKIEVDLPSRQFRFVEYENNNRTETYSSYGLKRDIAFPLETVPILDLQRRLQLLQ